MDDRDESDIPENKPRRNGHNVLLNGVQKTNGHSHRDSDLEGNGMGPSDDNMSQDGPLDFSVKRIGKRRHSESDDSRSSCTSSNVPHIKAESPDSDRHSNAPSPGEITHDSKLDLSRSSAAMAAMGLFPGMMGNGGVFNNIPTSMAAMMDPKLIHNSQKSSRPFKAYPKEALSMPVGYFGMPGYMPFPGMDTSVLQSLGVSSEELMSIYKQQLLERDKHGNKSSGHSNGNSSSGSSTNGDTTPIPSTPNNPQTSPSSNISLPPQLAAARATMVSSTSGSPGSNNSRRRPRILPDEQKDEAYWERRRKNNDAAKRSRDARRAKEDEIAIRAALLEQENLKLRVEVAALKSETARLRCMLYNN
ncbi:hypothetical protein SNE40_008655 [Patella caerulea]|uniref:BZIP domain-containing protein n=2 Tax=Patellogastropoda TaxID=69675 RepID=A0AAN8JML6_PATCE